MAHELQDRVALVTGGGRGFGREIAKGLAAAGAAVAVTARTMEQLQETVQLIEDAGGRAFAASGDVTSLEDMQRVVRETGERLGTINLLINNAGLAGPFGPVWHVHPDVWWNSQAVHVRAVYITTHVVFPLMMEQGGGRIINIASRGGIEITPHLSAYCVGKNTQIRLTEHIDAEGREHGVRAFAIEPGTVFTDMARSTIEDPEAQRWVPWMPESLKEFAKEDAAAGFARCNRMVVALASGRYDALSGRYLDVHQDLDALLLEGDEEE